MSTTGTGRTRPPPAYATVDIVAILTLLALALAGFTPTFAGLGWAGLAAAGVVLGMGWAVLVTTFRLGLDVVLATMLLPFLLTAGGIVLRTTGLFMGIPDAETVNRILSGTFLSWRVLVETAPPVDSTGSVMLIPFALGYFGACTATAFALRSRRSMLPALPLVLVLVAVLLLGFPQAWFVVLQGVVFGGVMLMWVAHRSMRIEAGRKAEPRLGVVPWGRWVAAAVIMAVVAVATLPFLDSIEPDRRYVLRETVEPYDSAYLTTPLSSFRRFRDQGPGVYDNLADKTLFRVRGAKAGTRVRIAVLDRYDGNQWYAANDTSPTDFSDRFLRISSRIDNTAKGEDQLYTFFVRNTWDLPWVPTIGAMQAFEFYDDYASDRLPDLRYNRATDTAALPGGLKPREDYVITSIPTPTRLTTRMKPWRVRDEELYSAASFLDIPARAWSLGAKTPMAAVFKVAERMRLRGRYSDGAYGWETRFKAGQDSVRLDEGFVNAPAMVGNDEQYAATMALLANRLGVPARVAVGTELGRNGVIKGKSIDAWVEIRVSNGSWRVLETRTFMGHRAPKRTDAKLPPVRLPPETQQPPAQQPQDQPQDQQDQQDQQQEKAEEPLPRWPLVLLVPALFAVIPGAKSVRRRRRRGSTPVASYVGGWDELLDTAIDLGVPVPERGTRPAQASALGVPRSLARTADVAVFTPAEPPHPGGFWDDIDSQRRRLRSHAPAWRTLLAPINPRSLFRR